MSNAGMKAKPEMRVEWHNLMQEGMTPEEIGQRYTEHPVVVVKTLRQGTPKIKGASYQHLSLPIPMDEIREAYKNGLIEDLARKYGVTAQTLKYRYDKWLKSGGRDIALEEIRSQMDLTPPPRKKNTRKIDKISEEEKVEAINAYYQSGRKFNCSKWSANILKQVLEEQSIPEKTYKPISSRYVVRLMDALMSINPDSMKVVDHIREAQRLLVNFTTDIPLVWKGQVLDLLFNNKINEEQAREFSSVIDLVALHMKKGDESNADS
jgi:hypothetical protein